MDKPKALYLKEKNELELLMEILNDHQKGMLVNSLKIEQLKVLSISKNDPRLPQVIKELEDGQEVNEVMTRTIKERIKEIIKKKAQGN